MSNTEFRRNIFVGMMVQDAHDLGRIALIKCDPDGLKFWVKWDNFDTLIGYTEEWFSTNSIWERQVPDEWLDELIVKL